MRLAHRFAAGLLLAITATAGAVLAQTTAPAPAGTWTLQTEGGPHRSDDDDSGG
ncbi:MAG: hypothetical protein M3R55_07075 [Acidobacteriota bacterium]|nr:hypothetical protein [Acidobacteriota bacterium]